jgi:general secretion pathway protein D
MSKRTTRTVLLALVCVLAGRLATAEAGPGKKRPEPANRTQVTYSVGDLVIPIDDCDKTPGQPRETTEAQLMELVRALVAPSSWQERGGQGTLQYYPLGMSLVVNQTPEAHAAIADLLKALRRLQDIQVAVELRMVSTSPATGADFRKQAGFETPQSDRGDRHAIAVFTDKELTPWLRVLGHDAATDIMMAPKLTMFSGQSACLDVSTAERFVTEYKVTRDDDDQVAVVPHEEAIVLGTQCKMRPTVSADRRFVHLKLNHRQSSLAAGTSVTPVMLKFAGPDGAEKVFHGVVQQPRVQALTVNEAFVIPDGKTLAIALGEMSTEVRSEMAPPVLRDVPMLRRFFTNVGYGREQREVFLLVTPRVIVNAESDE